MSFPAVAATRPSADRVEATGGTDRPKSGERIPALDALRGAAIIAVFLHHATPPTPSTGIGKTVLGVLHLGWAGVDLFFVLSGFLITGILLDTRGRADYFTRFYARRFRRIFPLYYVALALIVLALPLVGGMVQREAETVAASQTWYWFYASNLKIADALRWTASYADHFWTLAVEEQFYIVWPLLVLFTPPRVLARICGWIIFVTLATRVALVMTGTSPLAVSVFTLTRVDTLAFGALAACLFRLPDGKELARTWSRYAAVLGGGLAVAIALADVAGRVGPWWVGNGGAWATVGYSALGAAFSAVVVRCALAARQAQPGALFRFLRLTGTYSYGLYVIHAPVLYVIRDLGWSPTGLLDRVSYVVVAASVSYAVAALSWHYFEAPILGRGSPSRPTAEAAAS